jgi:hypothetical protein
VGHYYRNALDLIKKADELYEDENPFWSKFSHSPLSKMLKQSLAIVDYALPYIQEFVPATALAVTDTHCSRIA